MEWMNSRFAQPEQARKSMFLEHIAQEQRCPCWLASWPLSWGHSPVSTMAKQILMLAYQQLMPRTPWRPELPWPGPTFSDRLHKLWLFLNEMCLFFVTSSWVLIEPPAVLLRGWVTEHVLATTRATMTSWHKFTSILK